MTAPTSDFIINALPLPVLTVGADGAILHANMAAETFLDLSLRVMQRQKLTEIVPFGSPILGLIDEVRRRGASVSEYRVDLGRPRIGGERIVDVFATPLGEDSDIVVLMLQERTIADKMDRQLTHRGAARSITALGAMLAHEIKNPLSGIRGAAQLLEQSRRRGRPGADPPDLRRSRPDRASRRAGRAVRRRAPGRARRRSTCTGCSTT